MRLKVKGVAVDCETRCAHYHSDVEIIAIRPRCCGAYYACRQRHDELASHPAEVWPKREWSRLVVLCGACGAEMSANQYLACANQCPACQAPFNPGRRGHHHFHFEPE